MSSNMRLNKICQHCQQEFIAKITLTRYCSHTCNRKTYKQAKREEKIQSAEPSPVAKQVVEWEELEKKPLLTLNEAALLLHISPLTRRRWLKDGIIKSNRLGKKHLFDRGEIERKLLAT